MAAAAKLTLRQLNRATLARQMLLEREAVPVVDAVERLAGMQAQEPRPPFVGLWSRLQGFRREDLSEALLGYEVVRGPLMRSTLHLLSAADFAAFRPALTPALNVAVRALGSSAKGLDGVDFLPVAIELLREEPREYNELRILLSERFPDVHHRALGYAVRTQLPLVMVPTDDPWAFPRVARFALAEDRLGCSLPFEGPPESMIRSYLAAFGPATAADFVEWSGLKRMKPAFEELRPALSVFEDESGRELFDLPDAPRPDAGTPAPPRFLPEFDSLVLAHADRSRILAAEHRPGLVTKNLRVKATFLWDGSVAGTWTVERKRGKATLRISPFEPLPRKAVRGLGEEGERLLRFGEGEDSALDVKIDAP
jgi:winged helix DNA-binding protein